MGVSRQLLLTLFQCSASVWHCGRPPLHRVGLTMPTAQTLLADTAVTLLRKLAVLPGSFGLGTRVQAVPFQRSMSGVVAAGMPGPGYRSRPGHRGWWGLSWL